jgi:hypothetical protein
MWKRLRRVVLSGLLVGASLLAALGLSPAERADAQLMPGEYCLYQDGLVGWVCVTADRSEEWWAYLEGSYVWGNPTHTALDPWELSAAFRGAPTFGGYAAWKASVLQRPESAGRTVVFQRHLVTEESVQN